MARVVMLVVAVMSALACGGTRGRTLDGSVWDTDATSSDLEDVRVEAPEANGDGGGPPGSGIGYAATVLNRYDSANEVIFRRIDVATASCVLVDVLVAFDGTVRGSFPAYALEGSASECASAVPSQRAATASAVTGTITSPDRGKHFDLALHITFPSGYAWLPPALDFTATALPVDGTWQSAP